MNCNAYQFLIALHIEADLPPSQVQEVEAHLRQCPTCQKFQRELQASQNMVRDLAHERLDPASFDVVRQRVMQQVSQPGSRRRPWWQLQLLAPLAWRPLSAAACVLVLGLLFVWHWFGVDRSKTEMSGVSSSTEQALDGSRKDAPVDSTVQGDLPPPQKEQKQPRVREWHVAQVQTPPEQAPEVAPEPDLPVEQGSILEPDQSPADVPPEEPEPLVIKLVTDDPNIIIVWLVDQKAGIN